MSWYEETSKNNDENNKNNNENNDIKAENTNNNEEINGECKERTVDAQGYINSDDPSHAENKSDNVYDRPFNGTTRERIDEPAAKSEAKENTEENKPENEPENKSNETSADGGKEKVPYYDVKVKPKKKNRTFSKAIAVCLVVSLGLGTGIGAGYGFSRAMNKNSNVSSYDGVLTTTAAAVSSSKANAATDVIANVYNSVVSITTLTQGTANYGMYSIPYQAEGAGSGVIFAEDDSLVYVATNQHGYDETSDLAVLSVEKSDLEAVGINNVTIAVFDDSADIKLGESVIAIGNSLGEGKTTTGGMISAENKTVNVEGKELNVIQTDAAINPGNSGGALVNYSGAVIGINTAKTFSTSSGSTAEGVGYAIPASVAVPILNELKENGSIEKPYLGITGQDITDQLSSLYRLPVGVLVTSVMDGSSAANAGIVEGDIIVSYNGKTILNMESLVQCVDESSVGDQVKIGIIRNGDTSVEVTATLGNVNAQ